MQNTILNVEERKLHETTLEGGVFAGILATERQIRDGHVVHISVQRLRDGNGAQKIQSSRYAVSEGKGVAL